MGQNLIAPTAICQTLPALNFPQTPVDDDPGANWSATLRFDPRGDRLDCIVRASDGFIEACFITSAPVGADPDELSAASERQVADWWKHLHKPIRPRGNLPPNRLDRRLPGPPARRRN